MNITVSGYNRPEYLERTLSALAKCDGVDDCQVVVTLDPCAETQRQIDIAKSYGFTPLVFLERVGCNAAIRSAIQYGFEQMGGDFHLHLEDDCVPTRDALMWFGSMSVAFRGNPSVMSVSGYQRTSNGRVDEGGLRRWFTPWGWGVWRDRWVGLAAGWVGDHSVSWDIVVNHGLRAGRYEVYPTVSRIQNIGAELGTHVPGPEWHAANHHVSETADDIAAGCPAQWKIVSVSEHADHA